LAEWIGRHLRRGDASIIHLAIELQAGRRRVGGLAQDRLHGPRQFAVPVEVERRRQVAHHAAGGEDIHVDEVGLAVLHEVFVGDVAPA
jgi:hypothetical protein